MLYKVSLTVPAGTAEGSPESALLQLTGGVSLRREVYFPDGCHGLVGASVWHYGVQILPWTQATWLTGDGGSIVDATPYPIIAPVTTFTLYAYNEDTVNNHTIQLRVTMREGEVEEFLNLEQFLNALRGV